MSFASQFRAGQDIARSLMDTYDRGRTAQELKDIAQAKAEESKGFTSEQGQDLEAAAARGDKVDVAYKDDGQGQQVFDRYVVTPKMPDGQAGPPQVRDVAQQGVTDFMGQRTAGSMSEGQVNSARERAMAGVVMKQDPVKGMRMLREVTQGEREDERYGWEKSRNERDIRVAGEQDADKAFLKTLDAEVGDWIKTRVTGPDGMPREMTMDDHLAGSQFRASRLASAGKMEEAGKVMKEYSAQALGKITLETAQRNDALGTAAAALAAGDLGPVKEFYNRFTPDGAQVTNITRGPKGELVIERATDDGRPLPPTTMQDTGQLLASLNTFKDPMALYNWSQNEFKNNLAIKADGRADRGETRADNADARAANADARAGAAAGRTVDNDAEAKADKKAKAAAAMAIFKERNPGATATELEAVRAGILDAVPKAGGIESDFKPDAYGSGGTVTQRDKNGNVTVTKLDSKGQPGVPVNIGAPGRAAAPPNPVGAKAQPPAKGAIQDGYEFLGGNPKDPKSWRQVVSGKVN